MRNLHLLLFTTALGLNLSPHAFSQAKLPLQVRRDDAIRLTNRAHELSNQAKALVKSTKDVLLAESALKHESATTENETDNRFNLEVRSSLDHSKPDHPRRLIAPESQTVLRNYADIMARYRAALSAYMQHRQQVQQHAAAFHAQAQDSNATPPPVLAVPAFRGLAVQTQDACGALQQAEAALHQDELSLFQLVQVLTNNRKSMTQAQYEGLWYRGQNRAVNLKQSVDAFDQNVFAKQTNSQEFMHGKMEQAMRDGDYVLSQKVYGDQQRTSWLLNQEMKRASTHSALATQFLYQLQTLNPNAPPSSQSSSNNQDPNQFIQDDRSLAQEFEQVQQLYKQVEEAAPRFPK